MMKKLYFFVYIDTHQKVRAFQKFMLVLVTLVAINSEEMLKKDFTSKYFLEVRAVAIRTKNPVNNYLLLILFLEFAIICS